jgi:hypothetical protein
MGCNILFSIHSTENPIYVFPEMKLRGLVPNSYIHVRVDSHRPLICSVQDTQSKNVFMYNVHKPATP